MNTFRLHRAALIIALIPAIRSAVAQHAAPPLTRLESSSDTTRMRAFYEIVSAADDRKNHPDWPRTRFLAERAKSDDRVAVALLGLLDRENAKVDQAPPGSLSEDYLAGYYLDLLTTVARMHDRRSINALVGGIGSGSGVVEATLADFGDLAVPLVLREVSSGDRNRRTSAVLTLRAMTTRSGSTLSAASQSSIAHALLRVVQDTTSPNRGPAIEALVPLSNEEIRPVMETIVANERPDSHAPRSIHATLTVSGGARTWLEKHPKP